MDDPEMFRQGGFRLAARTRGAAADEAQLKRLRAFAQQEDALADAVVEWLHREPQQRSRVDQALAGARSRPN